MPDHAIARHDTPVALDRQASVLTELAGGAESHREQLMERGAVLMAWYPEHTCG